MIFFAMFSLCRREALRSCCTCTNSFPCHKKASLDPSGWRDAVGAVLAFPWHHSLPTPPLPTLPFQFLPRLALPCFALPTPPYCALTRLSSCPCFPKTSQVLASPGAFLRYGCSSKVHHWHELSASLSQSWLGTWFGYGCPPGNPRGQAAINRYKEFSQWKHCSPENHLFSSSCEIQSNFFSFHLRRYQ